MRPAVAIRIYETGWWNKKRARLHPAIIKNSGEVVILYNKTYTRKYKMREIVEEILQKAKSAIKVEKEVEYYVIDLKEFRKLAEEIAKQKGYATQVLHGSIPGLIDITNEFSKIINNHLNK